MTFIVSFLTSLTPPFAPSFTTSCSASLVTSFTIPIDSLTASLILPNPAHAREITKLTALPTAHSVQLNCPLIMPLTPEIASLTPSQINPVAKVVHVPTENINKAAPAIICPNPMNKHPSGPQMLRQAFNLKVRVRPMLRRSCRTASLMPLAVPSSSLVHSFPPPSWSGLARSSKLSHWSIFTGSSPLIASSMMSMLPWIFFFKLSRTSSLIGNWSSAVQQRALLSPSACSSDMVTFALVSICTHSCETECTTEKPNTMGPMLSIAFWRNCLACSSCSLPSTFFFSYSSPPFLSSRKQFLANM